MSDIQLACASDERYVAHSAAMLHSAITNRDNSRLHVHYLCAPEFPEHSARALRRMVEEGGARFSMHRIPDDWVEGMPTWQYIGASMWYRIFLPDLLADCDRVLYLDVDTIVVDSMEPLWATPLGDSYLGAVTNVFQRHELHRPDRLGLPGPRSYFNSGVLLLNLDAWRADSCTEQLSEFARRRSADLLWPDQDTLNVVLGERRTALHPRWNCMNSILHFPWSSDVFGADAVDEARRNPGIRHFEGPSLNKPWHYMFEWEGGDLYHRHRRQTPWPRVEAEGRSLKNVVRRRWRRLGGSSVSVDRER